MFGTRLFAPSVMEKPSFAELDLWGPFLFFFLYCVLIACDSGAFTFAFSGGLFFAIACAITAQLISQVDVVSFLQYLCILGYSLITIDLVIVAIYSMIITTKFLIMTAGFLNWLLNGKILIFRWSANWWFTRKVGQVLCMFLIPTIILGFLCIIITAFVLMIQITTMMLTGTIYTSAHTFLEQRSWLLLLPIMIFFMSLVLDVSPVLVSIPIIILGFLWSIITTFALMIQTTTMMLTGTIYTSAHAFLEQRSRLLLLPIMTFYCFLASSFILSLDRDGIHLF
jgi:hypothetical protein